MNCAIIQPSYIPWRGYFDQIRKSDVFVFYDDVQYDRRGWRNRNRIKTPGGTQWITIPVLNKHSRAHGTPIDEIRINQDRNWTAQHRRTIQYNYHSAPFFEHYTPLLDEFYLRRPELLADYTVDFTIAIAQELGIDQTQFVRSSTIPARGGKTDRLLSIIKYIGATHYISGPSARNYMDENKFDDAGISLEYMAYDYDEYPQLHGEFDPQVSILDLMFMTGPNAAEHFRRSV